MRFYCRAFYRSDEEVRGLAFPVFDSTEHIIPCTREIAPKDEDANHHKCAENNLRHISHP
jgi:hypothetical protein